MGAGVLLNINHMQARGISSGMAYYLTPSITLEEEDFFSGQLLDSNDAFERQDTTLFLVRFSF